MFSKGNSRAHVKVNVGTEGRIARALLASRVPSLPFVTGSHYVVLSGLDQSPAPASEGLGLCLPRLLVALAPSQHPHAPCACGLGRLWSMDLFWSEPKEHSASSLGDVGRSQNPRSTKVGSVCHTQKRLVR